jgi:hypothetical protein
MKLKEIVIQMQESGSHIGDIVDTLIQQHANDVLQLVSTADSVRQFVASVFNEQRALSYQAVHQAAQLKKLPNKRVKGIQPMFTQVIEMALNAPYRVPGKGDIRFRDMTDDDLRSSANRYYLPQAETMLKRGQGMLALADAMTPGSTVETFDRTKLLDFTKDIAALD